MSKGFQYLDRPTPGWHIGNVMRVHARKWEWVGLMSDLAREDWGSGKREQLRLLRIPGKHQTHAKAYDALCEYVTNAVLTVRGTFTLKGQQPSANHKGGNYD